MMVKVHKNNPPFLFWSIRRDRPGYGSKALEFGRQDPGAFEDQGVDWRSHALFSP